MSERKHQGAEEQSKRDDREEAVLAADDTGMLQNEVDMSALEMERASDPASFAASPEVPESK